MSRTVIVKKRNFSAPLPADFYVLIKLTHKSELLQYLGLRKMNIMDYKWEKENYIGYFAVDNRSNRILFTGSYSKFFLVRWFQKLFEWLAPMKYELEYIPIIHYQST